MATPPPCTQHAQFLLNTRPLYTTPSDHTCRFVFTITTTHFMGETPNVTVIATPLVRAHRGEEGPHTSSHVVTRHPPLSHHHTRGGGRGTRPGCCSPWWRWLAASPAAPPASRSADPASAPGFCLDPPYPPPPPGGPDQHAPTQVNIGNNHPPSVGGAQPTTPRWWRGPGGPATRGLKSEFESRGGGSRGQTPPPPRGGKGGGGIVRPSTEAGSESVDPESPRPHGGWRPEACVEPHSGICWRAETESTKHPTDNGVDSRAQGGG